MNKSENLKYQLESLASYEPSDLDNPEFEVGYQDDVGNEGFATVCCVDIAQKALDKINSLEKALRWAKNNWTGNEPSESVMNRYFDELDIE